MIGDHRNSRRVMRGSVWRWGGERGLVVAAISMPWWSRSLHDGPLMLNTMALCMRRSRMAAAMTESPKMSPQSGRLRLVGWPLR